MNNFKALLI